MAKSYICLTDADGKVHYFDQEDLITQLVPAGLEMGGALAAACNNLIRKVREMREIQKDSRLASFTKHGKMKAAEEAVDKIVQQFSQVVERIQL